jgi:cell division septation protein DedD
MPDRRVVRRRLVLAGLLLGLATVPAAADLRSDLESARGHLTAGRIEEARRAYTLLTERHGDDPDARDAWYFRALLTRDGHDYVRCLDVYLDRGGRRDRRASEVELRAGRYHYALGDYRSALTRFESARDRRGDAATRAEARYWLGLTLLALREMDDARRALEAVVEDRAAGRLTSAALRALGELHRIGGRPAEAARHFERAAEFDDAGDAPSQALLGEAAARDRAGDRREAAALYAELLAKHGDTPAAAEARGWLTAREREAAVPAPAAAGAPSDAPAPPTDVEPLRPEPRAPGADWGLQVGAFAAIENARALARQLEERNFTDVRVERSDSSDGLYHVRVGRYSDRNAAEAAGKEVSAALGLRYQIVPPASGRTP